MPVDRIRIDELRLRLTGAGREEGRRFGEAVAMRLSDELPRHALSGRIARLELRVPVSGFLSPDAAAERIVQAILDSVR
jgi:hypothetical protein